ncbi:putative cytochrome P450 6a13 [Aphis craccivora]|uniref:Putative cytochrome P450 6a13 n=1 Tax=Aphis craccivora TaxID=307492 RepID=A0A6G0YSQ0_APHCR|nr:putative cytochrome P450 6a13 [Aphis craccivora]
MFEFVYELFDLKMLLVTAFLGAAYMYCTWTHSHWSKMGVSSPSAPVPLFGHAMPSMLGRMHFMDVLHNLYRQLGDQRFGGIYTMRTPQLLVKDPELIGHILIKDFNNFTDRGLYAGTHTNPLNNNIFFTRGERWKTMRQKLSPTFTANKLKYMNEQVKECSDGLLSTIGKTVDEDAGRIEIREMMAKYSTDVIGSCAFGLKLDAINDPDSEFRKHGKNVFQPSLRSKIRVAVIFMQPSLLSIFRVHHYSHRTIRFFHDAFKQTIEYREKHNEDRKDFVQHLMKAREDLVLNPNLKPEEKFTEMDIVANAYILFIAGFETVSTSMSFCMYELALRKDVQDKVRKEILEVKSKYNGQMNSECLNELHYMGMVIKGKMNHITSRNNAPISNYGGGFRWKNEYPWCIIEVKSKHIPTVLKKIEKNGNFYAKPVFDQIDFFIWFSNFYKICQKRDNLQLVKDNLHGMICKVCEINDVRCHLGKFHGIFYRPEIYTLK